MKITVLNKFNNYYNRIIKKYDAVSDYILNATAYRDYTNVDFNPSDGVTTELVINHFDKQVDGTIVYVNWTPDYLLVLDENSVIQSRWFVIESQRLRGGQYQLALRRDVIADNLDALLTSKMYIEKGVIRDTSNPLLYNRDVFNCNQIKKEEILLKDDTECPWLVLYLKKDFLGNSTARADAIDLPSPVESTEVYQKYNSLSEFPYNQAIGESNKIYSGDVRGFTTYFYKTDSRLNYWWTYYGKPDSALYDYGLTDSTTDLRTDIVTRTLLINLTSAFSAYNFETIKAYAKTELHYDANVNDLNRFSEKIIQIGESTYYRVKVYTNVIDQKDITVTSNQANTNAIMCNVWNTATGQSVSGSTDNGFRVDMRNITEAWVELEEIHGIGCSIDLTHNITSVRTNSALFDAICIPYGKFVMSTNGVGPGSEAYYSSEEYSLKAVNTIATAIGGTNGYVLDLQLLPFCPLSNQVDSLGPSFYNDTDLRIEGVQTVEGEEIHPIVFWVVPDIQRTLDVEYLRPIADDVKLIKFENDCVSYRLCSPNYNGVFEFNNAKNKGLQYFNVDMTLKPYQPYIHVNPDFKGLYSEDFDDCRGLICSGDFSLGILNDAWESYQIQNKNYQTMFNREIESMDKMNSITRQEAGWQIGAGTVTGIGTGATAGAMIGGGYGAIAGAAIGGIGSLGGGLADYVNLTARQNEAKDLAIDRFNMQLDNIKALPHSVSKVDSLTYNNKKFVFLERYAPTEVEKQAYLDKLEYDGMTIGVIDELQNWVVEGELSYVKAQLIRITTVGDDYHLISEIGVEFAKGVYL